MSDETHPYKVLYDKRFVSGPLKGMHLNGESIGWATRAARDFGYTAMIKVEASGATIDPETGGSSYTIHNVRKFEGFDAPA